MHNNRPDSSFDAYLTVNNAQRHIHPHKKKKKIWKEKRRKERSKREGANNKVDS
jgi:hypothetical protein